MTIENYQGTNYQIIKISNRKNKPADAVYIGRPSKWRNPFPLADKTDDTARLECVEKYRRYLWRQIQSGDVKHLEELILKKNQNNGEPLHLACFCSPKLCHGDVLAKALDWYEENRLPAQLTIN